MSEWSPSSWQTKTAEQQPVYDDSDKLAEIVAQLELLPPLVTSWEVESLKQRLARAAVGEMFLLQGGDCAESFADCKAEPIAAKLKILMQMSLVLVHAARKPVIRVGRIAGQYAKPRSSNEETRGEVTLPSYRGDLVNRSGFTREDRGPEPELLLRGYERAALTLNFIRALSTGGFADLHHPEFWDLGFAAHSRHRGDYERMVEQIRESLLFMESLTGVHLNDTNRVDFYTSHEGLALMYEQAQTRQVPRRDGWYNLSTHFPWIGKRTAGLEGAHVEYFRGIRNPVAVKVGPGSDAKWLVELVKRLNPEGEPGKVTLIHRFGATLIEHELPPLIDAMRRAGSPVLWVADPMHGNTESTAGGFKTRRFENILAELESSFQVHARLHSVLGGVHFELTGDNVTECIGGARGLDEHDLKKAYRTRVDPRLNSEQALEMAMLMARCIRDLNG